MNRDVLFKFHLILENRRYWYSSWKSTIGRQTSNWSNCSKKGITARLSMASVEDSRKINVSFMLVLVDTFKEDLHSSWHKKYLHTSLWQKMLLLHLPPNYNFSRNDVTQTQDLRWKQNKISHSLRSSSQKVLKC